MTEAKIALLRQPTHHVESIIRSLPHATMALFLALPACARQPLDLGSNRAGSEGGAPQGAAGSSAETATTKGEAGRGTKTSGDAHQRAAAGGTEQVADAGLGGEPSGTADAAASAVADPEVSAPVRDTNPRDSDCSTPPGWEERTAVDGQLDFTPREVWRGYVSSTSWPLPETDEAVLYVRSRDDAAITGAVVFGSGEVPEPATDPLVGYLPASVYDPAQREDSWDDLRLPEVWGGYALSALSGTVDGARVRFGVTSAEQWRTWCELVAGYPSGMCVLGGGSSGYDCDASLDPSCEVCFSRDHANDDRDVQVQCDKFAICFSRVCTCEGGCCTASTEEGRLEFDLRLENDGAELNGTITDQESSWNVFLTLDSDP